MLQRKLFLTFFILLWVSPIVTQAADISPRNQSGTTTLTIVLSNLHLSSNGGVEGDAAIQNIGIQDTIVNLGSMHGSESIPHQLSMVARNDRGQLYKLGVSGSRAIISGGRIDPMMVPLPQKAIYTIHAQWVVYPELHPGEYEFHLEFNGTQAWDSNIDMQGVNLFNYWIGKIESNTVKLTLPK